jgi:peptidoglycan/LPS O-acetylase OafA/YrhL
MTTRMTDGTATTAPITPLTGIRGLAAMAVLLYHVPTIITLPHVNYDLLSPVLGQILNKGYMGVDLFFILSGFVLSLVSFKDFAHVVRSTDLEAFWQKRFARVYPLHALIMVLYGAMIAVSQYLKPFYLAGLGMVEFVGGLLLLQIWLPIHGQFNAPAWSISAEAVAYLAFPYLSFVIGWCRQRAGLPLLFILLQVVMLLVAAYPWGHWQWVWTQPTPLVHGLDAVVRISLEFTLGCLLFQFYQPVQRLFPQGLDKLTCALLVLIPLSPLINAPMAVVVLMFALLILGLANGGRWTTKVLGHPRLVHLGEISYAMYLCHMLCFGLANPFLKRLPPVPALEWLMVGLTLVFTVVTAHVLYKWVEVPARQWLRRPITAPQHGFSYAKN